MWKKLLTASLTLLLLFQITGIKNAFADEVNKIMINSSDVIVMEKQNGVLQKLLIDSNQIYFKYNDVYDVVDKYIDEKNILWFAVACSYENKGYLCWISEKDAFIIDESFENMLEKQDFPEDYKPELRRLHAQHPNWSFVSYQTGIKWSTMLAKESVLKKNLINGSDTSLRSKMDGAYDPATGKYIPLDGTSWYMANEETIGYYMDPRNFLNERNIFQFLKLSFNEKEEKNLIEKILENTFMANKDIVDDKYYADIFYDAGKTANVSPIYLATLAKQEQGVSGSSAITGNSFEYNGNKYSDLYNFYNIGASSGVDNWKKGLVYANGGEIGTTLATSYGRPWNSPTSAINGGANWIANGYISKGQDTMYFQKFNCTSYSTYGHQYQTNVRAAYSQSSTMYKTYNSNDALDSKLTFSIPVYNSMPEFTKLPNTTIEVDNLKRINVNDGEEIVNFEKSEPVIPSKPDLPLEPDIQDPILPPVDEKKPDDETNDVEQIPNNSIDSIVVKNNLKDNNGYLIGIKNDTSVESLITTFEKTNTDILIEIYKENQKIDNGSNLGTGQTIKITLGEEVKSYTIVIKGDLDGDGTISTMDYLMYRKSLLGEIELSGSNKEAAKISDDEISTMGYLMIRKYLLGQTEIN